MAKNTTETNSTKILLIADTPALLYGSECWTRTERKVSRSIQSCPLVNLLKKRTITKETVKNKLVAVLAKSVCGGQAVQLH